MTKTKKNKEEKNMQNKAFFHDAFSVNERLQEIDETYAIVFNFVSKKFEVVSTQDGSVCFVVPFAEIDNRTIEFAKKTRGENIDRLIAEIDEENMKIEKKEMNEKKAEIEQMLFAKGEI